MRQLAILAIALALAACSGEVAGPGTPDGATIDGSSTPGADAPSGPTPDGGTTPRPDAGGPPADITCPVAGSAATAIYDETPDWSDTSATHVAFSGATATVTGPGATAAGAVVTITAKGAYVFTGTTTNGQIVVNGLDAEVIEIVLAGAHITSGSSAPIYVQQAYADVHLYLAEGTENSVTDSRTPAAAPVEPDAAIFSHDDLVIHGPGKLTIDAGYSDGIASKDEVFVRNGLLEITAQDDGVRGKDTMQIEGGCLVIDAGGDGATATNDTDVGLGNAFVGGDSALEIDAGGDGLVGVTSVAITGGTFVIKAGGGSSQTVSSTASAKGVKASDVTISGGSMTIDSADDSVHAERDVTITGGTLTLSTYMPAGGGGGPGSTVTGGDGIHAGTTNGGTTPGGTLTIGGGDITILKSYEGLEGQNITIRDGTVHVRASDDGVNASNGDGGDMGCYANLLDINGGYLAVNADGDGIDSNGSIEIGGGTVLVNGPTASMNGPMDTGDGGSCHLYVTGGTLVASGSSGMAINADSGGTTQRTVLVCLSTSQTANKIFDVRASSGGDVLTWSPVKSYQSVLFSLPALGTGSHGTFLGGSSTGTLADSLYTGGAYTPGTSSTTFSISGTVTNVGGCGGWGP